MLQDPLRNEWHAVLKSTELNEEPVQCYVLGERVAVFRTDSGVHAFRDLCIHRGAALSLGKVKDNQLICPYHAWEYNTQGTCVKIPAQPCTQAIPKKAKAEVYHCQEKYGLIWVCLSDEPKPILNYPEGDQPEEYRTVICGPYEIEANAPRVVENFLDISHLMFVHEGLLGDEEHAEVSDYRVHFEDGRYITDRISIYQPNPDGRSIGGYTDYVYEILSPKTARLKKFGPGPNDVFSLLIEVLQEKDGKTKVYMLQSRNFQLEEPDEGYIEFQDLIIGQDLAIVESQRPELLPLDLQEELHLKCDRLSISYRRWLKELGIEVGTTENLQVQR